jgi:hypothetical protein
VAGKGADVGDDDGLPPGDGGAAHALADGDAHAGRLALEGAEHELAAAQEIEARPVELRHQLEEQ